MNLTYFFTPPDTSFRGTLRRHYKKEKIKVSRWMLTINELLLRDTLTAKGKRPTPTPPINYLRLSYDNFTALDDIDASLEGHANRATANCIDLAHLATIESKTGTTPERLAMTTNSPWSP